MLWLGLYFPQLPLQSLSRAFTNTVAFAITDRKQANKIFCCNAIAQQQGIHPGMLLSAAYSLNPNLIAKARDPSTEQAALERLAAWGLQFTSNLNLRPPQSLLLEIAGSENYFGGRKTLLVQISAGLHELGYKINYAVAPTPMAALWLAHNKTKCIVTDKTKLPQQLNSITLNTLGLSVTMLSKLHKTGLRTIGDCLRLPRAQFSRRFGQTLYQDIDRALGERPDPQYNYQPPPRFHACLELPAEIEHAEALLFPLRRLVLELTGFLQARQQGIQQLQLTLQHVRHTPTQLSLQTVALNRDPQQWLHLLQTRLENIKLPQAVHSILLNADTLQPLSAKAKSLFPKQDDSDDEHWQQLLNRLHARMGPQAVYSIKSVADHRPEKSWSYCTPGEQNQPLNLNHRPLWLLQTPKRLTRIDCKLYGQGELQLCPGPERIESGWWDSHGVQRDYFVARNRHGARFWVFCDHRDADQWYLHGIFS